ncbi:MAG: flagellar protein FlbT [Desulfatitalea sp. BRH_c12]|nr:MAG: flagellar protein FlbT [Desulfatitalea sp. BRH_c12]
MALKIVLKPYERMIIGGAVVKNGSGKTEFFIENKPTLLREKDILSEKDADTLARKIYFTIQLMYIDPENLVNHHNTYWKLVQMIIEAAPSSLAIIDQISEALLGSRYYLALKVTRKLIEYEQEIIDRV